MTTPLALGDCDPGWTPEQALDRLCQLGAELLEDDIAPHLWDLRGQGLTHRQLNTITDIPITGSYLMTPATELRTAAKTLRDLAPQITGRLVGLADPVAEWLTHLAGFCDDVERTHGQQPPDDNPSLIHALAVARAINGSSEKAPSWEINTRPAADDDAYARGFAAGRRAR